jgi:hypothetical protein
MPLHEGDFKSIRVLIEKMLGQKGEYFITGTVIKRDTAHKLIWMAEFGDQAIPLVGLNYTVKYYDTDQNGLVSAKQAVVSPVLPAIGETVLVARELGSRRLPRLLGVLQGTGWISTEED